MLDTPVSDSRDVASSSPASIRNERQPLLDHERDSDRISSEEDEVNKDASPSLALIVRQIFTARQFAVMLCFFMNGLCTTGIGALIGGIESYYHLSDGPTAFIFPAGVAGYLLSTLAIQRILKRHGWRGIPLFSSVPRLIAAIILSIGPPFYIVLPAYFILGFGIGISDTAFCIWGSKVPYANVVQGMMHGSFSAGALLGPILALTITRRALAWYMFYRAYTVLSCVDVTALSLAFRHDRAAEDVSMTPRSTVLLTKHPLRTKAVWVCGIFFLIYVGIESSFTDWAIEFMRRVRHLDPTLASLSSTIFWIGMTLGRLSLGPVTEKFGLERCMVGYITLSTTFQILFKLTSDAALSLLFLGLNGICMGPMFPSGIILLATKVSSQTSINAIATVNAMGQLGGASAPLAIGILADHFGIGRMLDVVLGLSLVLLAIWLGFCRLSTWVER